MIMATLWRLGLWQIVQSQHARLDTLRALVPRDIKSMLPSLVYYNYNLCICTHSFHTHSMTRHKHAHSLTQCNQNHICITLIPYKFCIHPSYIVFFYTATYTYLICTHFVYTHLILYSFIRLHTPILYVQIMPIPYIHTLT